MPRKHRIPSYRLHKATNQAVVSIDGRDRYLGRHGTPASKAAYARAIAEMASAPTLPTPDNHDLTMAELIVRYTRHAKTYYRRDGKPTGEHANIESAMKPVRRLYGDVLVISFGPKALKACRQVFIDKGRVRKAINRDVHRIRGMFKWAAAEELIPVATYEALRTVDGLRSGRSDAVEGDPVRPVDDTLVDAVKPHVSDPVWTMIELQRLCGMRSGEVTIMRGVDLDTRGKVWTYTPAHHKTQHHGHARVIDIGPKGQALIEPYLKPDATAFLFQPSDAERTRRERLTAARKTPASCGNIVGSNRKRRPRWQPGDCYDVRAYRRAIARACEKAGVESWHPHQLRHNFGTRIRREFGLEMARAMLGQSTIAAAQIYSEFDRAKCADVAAKIG